MKNKIKSSVIFTSGNRYCSIEGYLTNVLTKSEEDVDHTFKRPIRITYITAITKDLQKWENTGKKFPSRSPTAGS